MYLNSLTIKILLILFIASCSIGIYFYIQNENLRKDNINKQNSIKVLSQNSIAYKESIAEKIDSISNLAIFVTDLKMENLIKRSKYNVLSTKFTVLQDSLIKLTGMATSTTTDSSIKVSFAGEKNDIRYTGYTNYNLLSKMSNYDISLYQNPIFISSLVYIDSSDIIRNDIYSNGKLISNAKTEIDSSIYLKIMSNNNSDNIKKTFFDKLMVFGNAEYDNQIKLLNLYFGMAYQFNDGFYIYAQKQINYSGIIYGLGYSRSIRELVKIF
jgi:fructose-specific phosphotransferase system component IIB